MASIAPVGADVGDRLRDWIRNGCHLPVDSSILLRLIEFGRDPDASPEQYVSVLSTSNSLTGKILSAVNSSWFGVRQSVKKLSQAVNLLGMVSVRMLSITHCVAAMHERISLPEHMLRRYWQSSLIKAEAAKYLAEQLGSTVADEAYLVGLMQDMAMPLMHQLAGTDYDRALSEVTDPQAFCSWEAETFGMHHAAAAEELARTLGIPDGLCEAIALHHDRSAQAAAAEAALIEASRFAGMFPHNCETWAPAEAAAAKAIIDEKFASLAVDAPVDEVLGDIEQRYLKMSEAVRPSAAEKIDLAEMLREATSEIAETATSLIGQVHSMMSGSSQAASQLAALNAEALRLEEQAQVDPLTEVFNRAGLEHEGATALTRLAREGRGAMLAFADLNDFKDINDRHGHDTGDEALRVVASTISDLAGPGAVVGRYGGDEFVLLIGDVESEQEAERLARAIVDAVAASALTGEDGQTISVGLSIGCVWSAPAPADLPFNKLLALADGLMYAGKRRDADPVQLRRLGG